MRNVPILINARDAGRLLDMILSRATRLAKCGSLPSVLLPDGEYRFRPADLEAWCEEHRYPSSKTERQE